MWPIGGYPAFYTKADSGENKCNCVSMLTQKKILNRYILIKNIFYPLM